MKVLYLFPNRNSHPPRQKILKECLENNFPNTLLLGLAHLHNFNIEYELRDLGVFLGQIMALLKIKDYDVIVCKDGSSGFLLGLLKKWNLIKKPLIFLDVVVHKNISGIKLKFLRYILSGSDKVIYCTSSLKSLLKEYFKISEHILKFVPWAVDDIFFYPLALEPQPFIFSAGDNDRDYTTLMEAAQNTGLGLKIATNLPIKKMYPGIEIMPNLHPLLLREEYAKAKIVVVPLHNVPSASGATTLLESMAMSKATIVSDSYGMRDFAKDGHNVIVVQPQDILSLRKAIIYLNENPQVRTRMGLNARATVQEYFNTTKQTSALVEVYRQVLKR